MERSGGGLYGLWDGNAELRWAEGGHPGACARGGQSQGREHAGATPGEEKTDTKAHTESPQTHMSQELLQHLESTHTKPHTGSAYKDPGHSKELYQRAKRSNTKQAWKAAHKARRESRASWETCRLERALKGDWKEVGYLRTRGNRGWETEFACNMAEKDVDPHQAIHEHLSTISAQGEKIDDLIPRRCSCPRRRRACNKSKKGKAVGQDKT